MEIKEKAIRFHQRQMSPNELKDFCSNDLPGLIDSVGNPESGKAIEFILLEYWQKIEGYTLFKSDFETEDPNFKYAGGDRADLRCARILDNVLSIILGSSKWHRKAKGVQNSEMEGVLTSLDSFRPVAEKYFSKNLWTSIRNTALMVSRSGVTPQYEGWINQQQAVRSGLEFKQWAEKEMKEILKYVLYRWEKQEWNYITEEGPSECFPIEKLKYHQKRLLDRYCQKDTISLLIDWACRQGKTLAACMLIKHRFLEKRQNVPMKILIISHIPTLLPQWEEAIRWVFKDMPTEIHYHSNGQHPDQKPGHHLFVLSSNQMLNPEDKDQGIDKKTNKEVIYKPDWDYLVYDEAHLALGTDNTLKQLVNKIKRKNFIGCSATPWTPKLMDGSLFSDIDRWQYEEALALKKMGHPDYQDLVEEITLLLRPDAMQLQRYKQLGIENFGYNINGWTVDQNQLSAIVDMLNFHIFSKSYVLNKTEYTLFDGIIRVGLKEDADLLSNFLRNYIDPISQKKLPIEVGVAHGDRFDLPGTLYTPYKGVNSSKWKKGVQEWLDLPKPTGVKKRVLIIVDQGHTGVTLPQLNWSTDLSTGKGLMVSTQFRKRTGSAMDEKQFSFHFELHPARTYVLTDHRRKALASSKDTILDSVANPQLNLWEVTGNNLREINEQQLQQKLNVLLSNKNLSSLLPSAEGIILTEGLFDSYDIQKQKNPYHKVELEHSENNEFDLDQTPPEQKIKASNSTVGKKQKNTINKKSRDAVQQAINLLPVLAMLEEIEEHQK